MYMRMCVCMYMRMCVCIYMRMCVYFVCVTCLMCVRMDLYIHLWRIQYTRMYVHNCEHAS